VSARPVELPRRERAMIARARHMFTRLCGLERGDQIADELLEARVKKLAKRDG
jgi:hypothetical protein